jgi:ABC-type transport system substrate-binding protein
LSVLAGACLRSGGAREAAKWAEELIALAPFREADPTGSRELWQRVDRELTDASPWVPLMIANTVNFLSKRAGNFHSNPTSFMLIDQLWVR